MSSANTPASLTHQKHRMFYILSKTFLNLVYSVDTTAGQHGQMSMAKEQSLYINLSSNYIYFTFKQEIQHYNTEPESSFHLQSIILDFF